MYKISVNSIKGVIKGEILVDNFAGEISEFCQDTRVAVYGSAFFAINGDAFDGHDYLDVAIRKGCKLLIIDNEQKISNLSSDDISDISIILVKSTTVALQTLAKFYLSQLDAKKIAITGSVGKTTTRDIVAQVCASMYNTESNISNFNSVVGVPLTILGFAKNIEIAILEMGMDKLGEIACMTDIVNPDISIITNVGTSHIERLGSRENIFIAKMEIAKNLSDDGLLIIFKDDYLNKQKIKAYISENRELFKSEHFEIIEVGFDEDCDYQIKNYMSCGASGSSFEVVRGCETREFNISLNGKHNVQNATLAIAMADVINIDNQKVDKVLQRLTITGKRLSIINTPKYTVIDDTYNASPQSMKAGLDVLAEFRDKRKVAILGDMYELGSESEMFHADVCEYAKRKADYVISVGEISKAMKSDLHFNAKEELIDNLDKLIREKDVIFVKASRGMKLEHVVDAIKKKSEKNG
ncbi:MAG: UDP-N-acetylmuramoyl-tripeptide--D-alanyl-D-alanine ligase [Eubacteriales bacterium]|nr:UDP-N-acetylmuramoyl-tripeptide--D-alanyl-D-alanine ligase [Eubacteriales bacterium]MDY3332154.1 UDP-N-acetylmuramoyl-tripeptide--D-alanyl-D-alanine ligase [Gallibacter sp.]